jgi:hypothetical protein
VAKKSTLCHGRVIVAAFDSCTCDHKYSKKRGDGRQVGVTLMGTWRSSVAGVSWKREHAVLENQPEQIVLEAPSLK